MHMHMRMNMRVRMHMHVQVHRHMYTHMQHLVMFATCCHVCACVYRSGKPPHTGAIAAKRPT